jgi:maleate isomerase
MADLRLTVGVVTPHAAPGPEVEIPAMTAGQVATVLSRIPGPGDAASTAPPTSLPDLRAAAAPSALDRAAAELLDGSVDALAYASTSSGYSIGFDAEVALVERLAQRWGVPVASSSLATVRALQAFGIERVAVVHPPWFDDETHDSGAAYFRSQGFDAVALRADALPHDPAQVRPGPIVDWVGRHVRDDVESVVFGGNGFRAAGAVERLERRLGCLVLEANQVLLWSILAATRTTLPIQDYGRLLREGHPAPDRGGNP